MTLFNSLVVLGRKINLPSFTSVRFYKRPIRRDKYFINYSNGPLWRQEKGMTANPNRFGPLTNLPDYSFLDGRPTPLGSKQKKRLERQLVWAETIKELTSDVDFARERYRLREEAKILKKQSIIDSKLKPKGITMEEFKRES